MMRNTKKEQKLVHWIKVVVLGSGAVGKSALTVRYLTDRFIHDYDPTFEDIYEDEKKPIVVDDEQYALRIVDTAGQIEDIENSFQMRHIASADVVMYVFSLTESQTLHDLISLKDRIDGMSATPKPSVMVGNKSDLTHMRCVSQEEAMGVANNLNCSYFEMSVASSSRESVDTVFQSAVKLAVDSQKVLENQKDGKSVGKSVKSALKWLKKVHRRKSVCSPMFFYVSPVADESSHQSPPATFV
uniref:small monomeric GTPase n=1 Tax=Halisarca dujardinii TaxID=2583056 RepID=A0AA96MKI4_HALDU|nr:ras-related and estrogen-regulated growth inhibitor-like protein [Halisarca dujardinii]